MKAIRPMKTNFYVIYNHNLNRWYSGVNEDGIISWGFIENALKFETEEQINDLFSLRANEDEDIFNALHNNSNIFSIQTIYTK
jgi:succinate dehydrogenase flavin-adding protein (antitoxin of CptAB toxin-antitoxin module)